MTAKPLSGDAGNYRSIALLLFISFCANAVALVVVNLVAVEAWLGSLLGQTKGPLVQLFFWGCTGATIACSMFVADDKELNELESLKEKPNPSVLRYPDRIDVYLYAQRIISSGFLAVFASVLLLAGLKYFDAPADAGSPKQQLFFVVIAMLIGLYEGRFLASLNKLSRRLFATKG